MKQKLFSIALVAVLAIAAGWNFNQSKNETKLSDLALANIDALANGEGGFDFRFCYQNVYYDHIFPNVYISYCGSCGDVLAFSYSTLSTCMSRF